MANTPEGGSEAIERARATFESLVEAIAEEDGAAAPSRNLDTTTDTAAELLKQVPEHRGMPLVLVRSIAAGIRTAIQRRVGRGGEDDVELAPQLWDWVLCYPAPPGPLNAAPRGNVRPLSFEERQAHSSPQERILRALAAVVAEKGYPDTTVADVVDRASTSQRAFYARFKNKEDATLAALDSASSQMLAAALPSFRRAPDWKHGVHDTIEALFAFGAAEPEFARLGGVERDGAGQPALDQREIVIEGMEGLLAPGYELNPDVPPVAAEAVGGALHALLYDQVGRKGPEALPELVPTLSYLSLAPFLDAEEAYEVSVG
jgi:AcrR family transcriptional regulator